MMTEIQKRMRTAQPHHQVLVNDVHYDAIDDVRFIVTCDIHDWNDFFHSWWTVGRLGLMDHVFSDLFLYHRRKQQRVPIPREDMHQPRPRIWRQAVRGWPIWNRGMLNHQR